jgi:hypothetical protein
MESVLLRVAVGVLVVSVTVAVASLIRNIAWPTIIHFPWKQHKQPQQKPQDGNDRNDDGKENRIVILAGSYNPPHRGHLAMLLYLSTR